MSSMETEDIACNPSTALHVTEKHGMSAVCVVVVNKTVCDCLWLL